MDTLTASNLIKVFSLTAVSALVALVWCPALINFLYAHKLWKKSARQKAISGEDAVVFNSLHKTKEVGTPRMGGLVIWVTVAGLAIALYLYAMAAPGSWLAEWNFLSREQTLIPLAVLVVAALFGLLDDVLVVSDLGKYIGGGLSLKKRLAVVALIGLAVSWWFYYKLGWDVVYIPFMGDASLGWWYIILFIGVVMATYAGGIIDGIDGLSGGTFISMYAAFGVIAFSLGKVDLAAFCGVIIGALAAFLWFNIPPARFYMTETGSLALTVTAAVIAFMTDSVYVLPIIGGLLVLEVASVIIQLLSKKFRGKKVFLSTPIHHHFEAIGWPAYKVTMRAWVVGIVLAVVGTAVRLLG